MSQTQLESLASFFRENVPARAMKGFLSRIDEMRFVPAARDMGLGQYRQAVIRYEAAMSWERFPYRECPPQLLMSLLLVWLEAADRELMDELGMGDDEPEWDVTVEDEETATVVVTVAMAEALTLIEDEAGPIPRAGKRWRLVEPEIWTAETAEVHGADETGAPLGNT